MWRSVLINVDAPTAAVGGAAVGISLLQTINGVLVPFFGVPLTVVTMAAGGALVSFAYGEPESSRKRLYTMAAANTFLASIFVAVIPRALGWSWSVPQLEPALAAMVAWGFRWAIPTTIKLVPDILRKVFRLDSQDRGDYRSYRGYDDYPKNYERYLKDDEESEDSPKNEQ